MKRLRAVPLAAVAILVFASSVAAWGVQADLTVNGSRSAPTVKVGAMANLAGTNTYDSNIGPLPIPVTWYVMQSVPYYPYFKPTYTGGNSGIGSFVFGTDPWTGKSAWNYSKSGSRSGTFTIFTNSKAKAEFKTGSTSYWFTHGTGCCHSIDAYFQVKAVVK